MFEADFEDGSLDVLASGSLPLELVAAAKSLAHWITTGVPLVIMAPVLGLLLNLDLSAVPMVMATMLVGTVAISFFGAIAAALTLRSRRSGVLIAIMVLPLYVPTLIYGVTTIALTLTPPGRPMAAIYAIVGDILGLLGGWTVGGCNCTATSNAITGQAAWPTYSAQDLR